MSPMFNVFVVSNVFWKFFYADYAFIVNCIFSIILFRPFDLFFSSFIHFTTIKFVVLILDLNTYKCFVFDFECNKFYSEVNIYFTL